MTTNTRSHSPVFLDPRQGSGYGSLNPVQYHKDSGDCGIYTCKSDLEKEVDSEEYLNPGLYDEEEDQEDIILHKSPTAGLRQRTDSLSHRSSDPFYFVGAAGAGHTTLRACFDRPGKVLKEIYSFQMIIESIPGMVPTSTIQQAKKIDGVIGGGFGVHPKNMTHKSHIRTGKSWSDVSFDNENVVFDDCIDLECDDSLSSFELILKPEEDIYYPIEKSLKLAHSFD